MKNVSGKVQQRQIGRFTEADPAWFSGVRKLLDLEERR
jgi:hypothetical protein